MLWRLDGELDGVVDAAGGAAAPRRAGTFLGANFLVFLSVNARANEYVTVNPLTSSQCQGGRKKSGRNKLDSSEIKPSRGS